MWDPKEWRKGWQKKGVFWRNEKIQGKFGRVPFSQKRMNWLSICRFGVVMSRRIKKGACKEGYVGELHH